MEEIKLPDPTTPQDFHSQVTTWLWQSDTDPWKEKDPTKWKWEPYSHDVCYIIEKALFLNQAIADLGDYEIDIKKMLQINKGDRSKVRRVTREVGDGSRSRFLIDLPEPVVITKDQKTVNRAFGNVQHFLDYIMKRTPQSYRLFQKLKRLNLDCVEDGYKEIIEEVVSCIRKGAETREKVIKTRISSSSSAKIPFILEAKMITDEILSQSRNLRDFLKLILKIYTMESFMCYWLNELLRSENWEEINILAPFLVCLAYTFQLQDYIIKYEEAKGLMSSFLGLIKQKRLALYRGVAMVKEHLECYSIKKNEYFSWNAVTSTSRSKEQAVRFIKHSLKKAQLENEPKIGVLFIIESDFSSVKDCEGMIDISQDSRYPDEQEVILVPGTVFKTVSAQLNREGVYEIKLKVKKRFKESQDLLGNLQQKVISKDKAIIDNLKEIGIISALQLLEGNQLVTKLEVKNCSLNSHLLELISNTRKSTNIKPENVILLGNTITVESLSALGCHFPPEHLDSVCSMNSILFQSDNLATKTDQDTRRIQRLILSKDALDLFYNNKQGVLLCNVLKSETQLTHITLVVTQKDLLTTIQSQVLLQHLSLDFQHCKSLDSDVFSSLGDIFESLAVLESLHLKFTSSAHQALACLKNRLRAYNTLLHLSLDFEGSGIISHQGFDDLLHVLKSPMPLEALSLNFARCSGFGDCSKLSSFIPSLECHPSLRYLDLNFGFCSETIDIGLERMSSLASLQQLSLNFQYSNNISTSSLNSLSIALKSMLSLQNLALNLSGMRKITDRVIDDLMSALESLVLLSHLDLRFKDCQEISDSGLSNFKRTLKALEHLQDLTLEFGFCEKITDLGFNHVSDALNLKLPLKNLTVNLRSCPKISDLGLDRFGDAVKTLACLQCVVYDFEWCDQVSKSGLSNLSNILGPIRDRNKYLH